MFTTIEAFFSTIMRFWWQFIIVTSFGVELLLVSILKVFSMMQNMAVFLVGLVAFIVSDFLKCVVLCGTCVESPIGIVLDTLLLKQMECFRDLVSVQSKLLLMKYRLKEDHLIFIRQCLMLQSLTICINFLLWLSILIGLFKRILQYAVSLLSYYIPEWIKFSSDTTDWGDNIDVYDETE